MLAVLCGREHFVSGEIGVETGATGTNEGGERRWFRGGCGHEVRDCGLHNSFETLYAETRAWPQMSVGHEAQEQMPRLEEVIIVRHGGCAR